MEYQFLNNVLDLYRKNKWQEILLLNKYSNIDYATKILWVWPDEEDIHFIRDVVVKHNLQGIISIGCGCGLLEWIIQVSTGLQICGFEVNEEWWSSKYSCPSFIKQYFPTFPLSTDQLNDNCAMLFCYFNDGEAFVDYIRNYTGNLVLIIGPDNKGRHTDPQPFNPNFGDSSWVLHSYREIKSSKDYIAAYVRLQNEIY